MQSSLSQLIILIVISTILILALVGFTIFIIFLYHKKQVSFLQNLETLKLDHEKSLLKTQLEIQEQTFQNISREIHDNIGLSLTLAKLNLNILELEKTQRSEELVSSSVDLIGKAINDLSDISKCLNSDAISQQGFLNALQLEIERLIKLNRFQVNFEIIGNPIFFDSQKELVLFRIAQEALNNIIKHANAQNISMRVSFNTKEVKLSIQDNGKGFCYPERQKSLQENMRAGLANMQIRSKMINGSINIESEIGKGTSILVTAPLDIIEN
jgi:two-component system, NarL family, sensor kinase